MMPRAMENLYALFRSIESAQWQRAGQGEWGAKWMCGNSIGWQYCVLCDKQNMWPRCHSQRKLLVKIQKQQKKIEDRMNIETELSSKSELVGRTERYVGYFAPPNVSWSNPSPDRLLIFACFLWHFYRLDSSVLTLSYIVWPFCSAFFPISPALTICEIRLRTHPRHTFEFY